MIGTSNVSTPIGLVTFHIVDMDTLFLLSIADIDLLKAKFDNLNNVMIQQIDNAEQRTPVIRKNGHLYMLLTGIEQTLAYMDTLDIECYLTEIEL